MSKILEICCDASIKTYDNGRTFGCGGAIAIGLNQEKFTIIPDTTNNRSELIAAYDAILLAGNILDTHPNEYDDVFIYSDSKFVVYGLKVWMNGWLRRRGEDGLLYNYNNQPVKNQELFLMIISYLVTNNLKFKFRHQKGHVKYGTEKGLNIARKVFYESNGYYPDNDLISRISLYNAIIDDHTRNKLQNLNTDAYPIMNYDNDYKRMCTYVIPRNYKEYIL